MKYIIIIDGIERVRYRYNVYESHEYDDGSVSEDCRIFCSDRHDEFVAFIATLKNDKHDG